MKFRISLLLICLLTLNVHAQKLSNYLADPEAAPRDHSIDVTKMVVEVEFEPTKGIVKGIVTHSFKPLRPSIDTLFWDAPSIDISEVMFREVGSKSWQKITHTTNSSGLITKFSTKPIWDREYEIRIKYQAEPRKGIYFIGWNSPTVTNPRNQTRKQIWTQGQGIDHRYWIPMYDNMNDKFITETIVKFDKNYKVLSNGKLKSSKEDKDGNKIWHYCLEKPHAGYLLMLAIDRYNVKETKTSNGTPVQFWYYPEHEDKIELTSLHTEKIIEFLEKETGYPYAWGTYSQVMVQDFMYGAMENTSATIFGDFFNVDENSFNDRNYVSVNAHELTHQWFGDLVTARSRKGTWLQESFATYYAKLFMGEIYGPDNYAWALRGEVNSALRASERDNYPVAHTKGGTSRVYPKGSAVLHMLRYVLGEEEFLRVINHYVKKHAFINIETNDLVQACEDVLGREMRWFFDQWVYRGGEPHYSVERISSDNESHFVIEQIHEQDFTVGTFKMPIKIGLYFKSGKAIDKTFWIEKSTEKIKIEHNGEGEIAFALFDVNSQVMKKLTMTKSDSELLAQMAGASNMIDRYDALLALKERPIELKRSALQAAYGEEEFWAMKAEIVRQLVDDDQSVSWLLSTLQNEDVRVRRVVLSEAKNVQDYKGLFLSALKDKSYINIKTAMERLAENDPAMLPIISQQTQDIIGQNHNVRLAWLELNLSNSPMGQMGKPIISGQGPTRGNRPTPGQVPIPGQRTPPPMLGMPAGDNMPIRQMRPMSAQIMQQYQELDLYCSNLYEFRTRVAAMQVVKKLNRLTTKNLEYLMDAAINPNSRLARPAIDVLKYFNEQADYSAAIQAYYNSATLSSSDKELLKETGLFKS